MSTPPARVGRRAFLAAAGLGALATGCSASNSSSGASSAPPQASFVFADAAAPGGLDPSLEATVEGARISSQILEGLVRADPSTGEPTPALAQSWQLEDAGRTVTFQLRRDVRFHDGSPVTADAVCRNVEKWAEQSRRGGTTTARTVFASVFRYGTHDPATPTSFAGCTAVDEHTVRFSLRHAYVPVLTALTHPAFGIASPRNIEDGTVGSHPVGTGPFRFESATGNTVRLSANTDYWGELGQIGSLEFRAMADARVRYAAFISGEVDAYDLVGLSEFAPLARNGTQVLHRDPYSVAYVGFNQRVPVLRDIAVRRAVAAAIDRSTLARQRFPDGTNVANQFVPARFSVNGENLAVPGFNPQRAKDLLASSSYRGQRLKFAYPRHTSRMYLQQPERVFSDIAAQLTRVGFVLDPVPIDWERDYIQAVTDPQSPIALSLLGRVGGFRDPDSFLGPLLGSAASEFGFNDAGLVTAVNRATVIADAEARANTYRGVNDRISRLLPALPLVHAVSAVAVNRRVLSFPLTSTGYERFHEVRLAAS